MQLLVKATSGSHEISVYEANQLYGEIGKYRFLQFSDHAIQGAIDLKNPKRIVLEYPRAVIHLMERNNPAFENVFMIGHGIGTIPANDPDKRFIVAEIDERVVELSRAYFHYQMDNVRIGDGRRLLCEQERSEFDFIILDAFTEAGTPYHLTTLGFFELAKDKLNAKGSIILNLMGKVKNDKIMNAIYTTLGAAYAYAKVFSLPAEHIADIRNIIIVGSCKAIDFDHKEMAGFYEIELEEGHILMDKREE
ncbi:fused MFS/spermidine synthase [Paenibacillus sp. LHD-38]|uniref:spermidine synthase n=1 Tax=Paenibacillus sp. LHD-38 TaxID=3072143 RepID=UPI00280CA279|nr:fused MFS/spermidine synthase [Paenibacillus sp. LHD-38]MDQ8734398.1 fused MFS/spermidine synthase [Paenibacillus sp. LHD-38]